MENVPVPSVSVDPRKAAQVRGAIEDLLRSAAALDREIAAEEAKTRNADVTHAAYSLYARATRARRENILRTVATYRDAVKAA